MMVFDYVLRFCVFVLLSSISFLLITPLILDAISFWTRVFKLTI
jgi:hypothetical protein